MENGVQLPEEYRPHILKRKLINAWPELSFISQPRFSDLVCFSHITVGDAIRKAQSITSTLQSSKQKLDELQQAGGIADIPNDVIIHRAVGILREDIAKCQALEGEFYSYS